MNRFSCDAALDPVLAAPPVFAKILEPGPGQAIALGPVTLNMTAFGLAAHAVEALVTLVVAIALARLVPVLERFVITRAKRARERNADESVHELTQRIETLTRVTGSVARTLIWSLTLIVVLGTIGISVAPLLAGAGIAGVAVGFGAQSIVKDFFSGFFFLFEDQFGVGDTISVAGVTGTVERMTLRITMLRDANGTAFFVPNSIITTVANRTLGWVGVNLDAPFSVAVPEGTVQSTLKAAKARVDALPALKDGVLLAPIAVEGPVDLAAGAVTYRLAGRAHSHRAPELRRNLIAALQAELVAHGLVYEAGTIVVRRPTPGDSEKAR